MISISSSALEVDIKIDVDTDIKILEGMLKKKQAPSLLWQINDIESLCWDSLIHKITFLYGKEYMILQFAEKKYKAHVQKYIDEFFDRIQKKIGAFYESESE